MICVLVKGVAVETEFLVKTRPMTASQMTVSRYEAGAGYLRFAYLGIGSLSDVRLLVPASVR